MAIDHNSQAQEAFDVVEALYQEAELTRPTKAQDAPSIAIETQDQEETPQQAPTRPMVIQSRKARVKIAKKVPIFTRISDLYEEAEAEKLLAQETAQPEADDAPAVLATDNSALQQANEQVDDFSDPFLPASFDAPKAEPATDMVPAIDDEATEAALAEALAIDETASAKAADETSASDDDFMIPATFGATDDELDILAGALANEDENNNDNETPEDNLTISEALEPAVSLDDAIDQLDAQLDAQTDAQPNASAETQSEAAALAALDATRPQADAEMTQQLQDVRSAVASAQSATMAPSETITDDAPTAAQEDEADGEHENSRDDESNDPQLAITPGPELVAFIGETVREVLDEQLPTMVRGLVDEALGERQGRYGRSDTPHIGLRTKPSRH